MNYSVVYGRVGRRAFLFRVLMCQNKWAEVVLTGHNEMTEINGIGREKRERTDIHSPDTGHTKRCTLSSMITIHSQRVYERVA